MKDNILVVDDDKRIHDTFMFVFDEYKIISAFNGVDALNILKRPNNISLIVLDVMMPGITGIEVLVEIKRVEFIYKVLILTGSDSKDIIIEALRAGADEYIEKPFDIEKTKVIFEKLLCKKKEYDDEEISSMEKKIKRTEEFIKKNYNKSILWKDACEEAFLSPKYFSQVFKEKTGKSFNNYKLDLRVTTGKWLLKKTSLTVGQIAYKVGYQTPEAFMKMFKQSVGITPTFYRGRRLVKKRKISVKKIF